ncbi:hypothetical protein L6452_17991 [Arctium lappa]|uniref:Uncharacterized protein n=1 Tax=Arctium lappa TaxID=4217 RepID=A0ACB9C567_ARCLA|nr:hypothetical protein L6452_17991 [Arctium lappa]
MVRLGGVLEDGSLTFICRAIIAEFIATLLLHYITVLTVIGYKSQTDPSQCGGVGSLGITSSSFIALPVILPRAVMSCTLWLNAWVQSVKSFQKTYYHNYSGGANELADGYSKGTGLGAEMIGTFVLVYTVFSATDPKRNASDSHVPVLAPLPIGFAVFMVHLATILITAPESTQLVVLVPPSFLEKTKPGMIKALKLPLPVADFIYVSEDDDNTEYTLSTKCNVWIGKSLQDALDSGDCNNIFALYMLTVPRPHLLYEAQLVGGKSHDIGPMSCPEQPDIPGELSEVSFGFSLQLGFGLVMDCVVNSSGLCAALPPSRKKGRNGSKIEQN